MQVLKRTIYFKSDEGNYWKECTGAKANTIRRIPQEEMEKYDLSFDPRGFMKSGDTIIDRICIYVCPDVNSVSSNSFDRRITDVSPFEDYYIFSWDRLDA